MVNRKPNVATSIPEWADKIRRQLGIKGTDPDRDDKIWAADTAGWCFSSGSDLDEKDYLLLRVIWTHHGNINKLSAFIRNNPELEGGSTREIYERIKPELEGYLEDIRPNKDGTRPRSSCGKYSTIKEFHNRSDVAELSKKVHKKFNPTISASPSATAASTNSLDDDGAFASGDITTLMAETSISGLPATPVRRGPQAQPSMETPVVATSYPVAGGTQNPATTDEYYVNMAILVLLQQLLSDMRELATDVPRRRLDFLGLPFEDLDWLVDRLSLKLYSRESGGDPVELMEARVDGYLCKRGYKPKPCVRRAGASAIRWQESAEMASWVSSLAEESEHFGLLQSSSSGRKRRLLLSRNREEIYITIAEYGEAWKQYIRTGSASGSPSARKKGDGIDLAGSDVFVRNSIAAVPKEFEEQANDAEKHLPVDTPNRPRLTRAQKELKLLDNGHFCFMNQWGPFSAKSDSDMDLLLRRLIGFHVQLLATASGQPI
ncbi:uncharacterized protein C8A04DRAFT_40055 [Dichotomopilus funicola]|uniref:Uncharacterized protein n=1 Tax=Dichotomopilus funicola TaxID=1934379 RepID=A0AAN6UXE4_9PEZI|nr:hypothetical protein C8A04DRAFT_40055 [Dichotomopilus funicola]